MHSKMYQRILAIFLIITLTFANPLLITKSFAASIFDNPGDTGNKNVEFTVRMEGQFDEIERLVHEAADIVKEIRG